MTKKAKTQKKPLPSACKALIKVAAGIAIIAGTSGLVFGLTAGLSQNLGYIKIKPYMYTGKTVSPDSAADYSSLQDESAWQSAPEDEPISEISSIYSNAKIDTTDPMESINNIQSSQLFGYAQLIIDSNAHVTMDKSFNESSYLGLTNWVHQNDTTLGADTWQPGDDMRIKMTQLSEPSNSYSDGVYSAKSIKPTSDDNKGFINSYTSAINSIVHSHALRKGSIILGGFLHETPVAQFIAQYHDTFEKVSYLMLDSNFSEEHISTTSFRSDQASFLCGIAICQYLQSRYDDVYSKVNNGKLAVGTFGGLPIPTVTSFMGGFEWGIYFFNNFILPKYIGYNDWDQATKDKRTVDLISAGKSTSFYTNSFNTGDARLLVQQLLTQGADAILPVAGPQTIDAVNEVRCEHSPTVVIGVDTDQENGQLAQYTSLSPLNYGDKIIQFSAQKNLAQLGSLILQAQAKGIRGYYYDQNEIHWLDYDGIPLVEKETSHSAKVSRSFVGNAGYLSVGNVSNGGVMISKGDDTKYQPEDPFGGTGWDSLRAAMEILSPADQFEDYNKIIEFLYNTTYEFPDPYGGDAHVKNPFDMLDENKYFMYS